MKVFQLNVKVLCEINIRAEEVQGEICSFIDKTLGKEEEFLKLHKNRGYKMYSFNSLYPLEKDKVYKKGNTYTFNLRTIDPALGLYLLENLKNTSTSSLKGLKVDIKEIKKHPIEKIYSLSPTTMKNDFGYWKKHMSLDEYEKRLRENMIKKYKDYTGEDIREDFPLFSLIEFNNKKPIGVRYKNVKILSDKITLIIEPDELSQKIAYMAIGVGLLEMNSRGFGYVNYKWF